MTTSFLLTLLLGAATGGFINGLAGFGTALFALGIWLRILPPEQAVPMVLVLSVLPGIQGLWVVRKSIEPKLLMPFLIPALIGAPIGVWSLQFISSEALKLTIAVFLITYGAYFSVKGKLPRLSRVRPGVNAAIGLVSGWLGGAAGLSGALPSMWTALHDWDKGRLRGVIQTFNFTVLGFSLILFAWRGAFTRELLIYCAIALPATMIMAQVGLYTFKRLSDDRFRRLLIVLMFASGLTLLLRELL